MDKIDSSDTSLNLNIIDSDDFDINNHKVIENMINHIEISILGKIPEITRYYEHYGLIFEIINNRQNMDFNEMLQLNRKRTF